jgi:hypothetical protein
MPIQVTIPSLNFGPIPGYLRIFLEANSKSNVGIDGPWPVI